MDIESKGANVLPFGLTTDVSANALAAGSGGLPRVGLTADGTGTDTGFEQELSAFSEADDLGTGNAIVAGLPGMEFPAGAVPGEGLLERSVLQPADGAANQQLSAEELPNAENDLPLSLKEVADGIVSMTPELPEGQLVVEVGQVDVVPEPTMEAAPGGVEIPLMDDGGLMGEARQDVPDPNAVPVDEVRIVGAAGLAIGLQGQSSPVPAVGNANSSAVGNDHGAPFILAGATGAAKPGQFQVPGAGDRKWQNELPTELRAPISQPVSASQSSQSQAQGLAIELPVAEGEVVAAKLVGNAVAGKEGANLQAPLKADGASAAPATDTDVVEMVPTSGKAQSAPEATTRSVAGNEQLASLTGLAGARSAGSTANVAGEGGAAPTATVATSAANVPLGQSPLPEAPLTPEAAAAQSSGLPKPETQTATDRLAGERSAKASDQPDNAVLAGANTAKGDQGKAVTGSLVAALPASQVVSEGPDLSFNPMEASLTSELGATVRGGDLTGAVRTESLQTPNQSQSGQVATQVAAEIARNLKNGHTRFQMRFDPPELGRVDVNMKVASDGSVQAHLIVERPETLDMFMRDQRGLERALEAAGLNADSEDLQFSLKQENEQGFASGDGQSNDASDGSKEHAGSDDGMPEADTEEIIRLTLAEQRGGLDVKI